METIFKSVYHTLKWLEALTGFSYREVNIILYFIIIPGIFSYYIGALFKSKIPVIGFLLGVLILCIAFPDFKVFSSKVFDTAVDFLNWFESIGLNYIQASVVFCVIVPLLMLLTFVLLKKKFSRTSK